MPTTDVGSLVPNDDDVWPLQWSQYDAAWMMIDDLDGALEMDDDGPLMEIAYDDDGPLMTLMMWWSPWWCSPWWCCGAHDDVALDDDGGAPVGDWFGLVDTHGDGCLIMALEPWCLSVMVITWW
jgi:hypothetical protein